MSNEDAEADQVVIPPKGIYTYNVICSFTLQYSFPETEIEQDPEGVEGADFNPTDQALKALEQELVAALEDKFPVRELEAYAQSDELLGIVRT